MATASELKAKIELYQNEISSFTMDIEIAKEDLERAKEMKRSVRGGQTGRISSSNYSLLMSVAQYDVEIARCQARVALCRNQIKLRKEAIAEFKKELKELKK